ncbi:hypothetical protein ABH940_005537 [Streptacidiphilus sp. BW17]|uniref:hypothetical protein n=1 Tax=Streptacidiphilus sp. BW17 TaxID=3156274 RepID=UPI00351674A0
MSTATAVQPSVPHLMQVLLDAGQLHSADQAPDTSWLVHRTKTGPSIALDDEGQALAFVIDTLLDYHLTTAEHGADLAL